jgi:uncharacterized membrane protein YoaK (UPF0700 family)
MFVSQAHSLSQQAKLAVTLAWIAGYTNILTLILCGIATSHVTGTTAGIGRDLAESSHHLAWLGLAVLASFLLGSITSGICTEVAKEGQWESIYGLPMALEAGLLSVVAILVEIFGEPRLVSGHPLAPYPLTLVALVAAAMGLQNATATRISTGVVRTTHVTGVLTDLGLDLAQMARSLPRTWHQSRLLSPPKRLEALIRDSSVSRAVLLILVIIGYLLGAWLGVVAHDQFARAAFIPPVLFLVVLIYQDLKRPVAAIVPAQILDGEAGLELPDDLQVYHLRHDAPGQNFLRDMPNFLAWVDSRATKEKVVLLDLGINCPLDNNAALELGRAMIRARQTNRRLILAGINAEKARLIRTLHPEANLQGDLCPDLDLALAHAIIILEDGELS